LSIQTLESFFRLFFPQIYTLRTEFFCRSRSAAVTSSILPFDLKLNCPRIHRLERLDPKSSKGTQEKKRKKFYRRQQKTQITSFGKQCS
jgi:hypothetical protein